jgi:hypothetical protein
VVLKRARFFLTARGKRLESLDMNEELLRSRLVAPAPMKKGQQLSLFDGLGGEELVSAVTGEL